MEKLNTEDMIFDLEHVRYWWIYFADARWILLSSNVLCVGRALLICIHCFLQQNCWVATELQTLFRKTLPIDWKLSNERYALNMFFCYSKLYLIPYFHFFKLLNHNRDMLKSHLIDICSSESDQAIYNFTTVRWRLELFSLCILFF